MLVVVAAAVSGVLDRGRGLLFLFGVWKRLWGGDTYTYALWVEGIGYGLILHAGFAGSLSCLEIFISFVPETGSYSPSRCAGNTRIACVDNAAIHLVG